ncbi:UDP-N-acetylmuramoyl-L-alanyl-D-glutamate--2,6-diaminopimelate ligase [Hoyosella rhizosphaerae]|uniref:UDP-N-acetylmuramoyl-L-alanyl-D-glutamate--2,6-diaminopimelate ligase n=1 Tax=Hoyosella rhizosphaerae TaxID=1755582 RepID=A0A916UER9_9ACTN|nr:UDP-N-acetylmuramoyl-L-alanyl-D-glutamate--2,6-diaminopimelate ligase [Hoyosella rhizosphaerae]
MAHAHNDDRPRTPRPHSLAPVSLATLATLSDALLHGDPGGTTVRGVELRAQDILQGDLFAALPGIKAHGASFAADAVARGAVAVLTDHAGLAIIDDVVSKDIPVLVHQNPRSVLGLISAGIYDNPSEKLTLIGITGTSGKTTTAYLVEGGIAAAGYRAGLIGTVETRIDGVPIPSALTTPEAPQLQALLAVMVERGIDYVVMEVSSHALALGRVDACEFAVGGFTNLSQDHLDFHSDLDDYFSTKAQLFDGKVRAPARRAVVCVDDDWGSEMARRAIGDVTTVSADGHAADWIARAPEVTGVGVQRFTAEAADGTQHVVSILLPGRYNVANAILSVALLDAVGIPAASVVEGLAKVQVPGRMERVDRGQQFLAVVDYAHKPGAVEAVLATLRAQTSGKIALVLGAGGNRDAGKRTPMGEAGARGSDYFVITDDNPRDEDPSEIRAELAAGARRVPENERAIIREIADRSEAIGDAVRWVGTHGVGDDVVVVAGKGHESGQEVLGVKQPFDDRIVLASAIDSILGGVNP